MLKKVDRKSMKIRPSGRSSDYISPSFGYGCLFDCGYCYMKRHLPEGLSISKNTEQILTEINNHVMFADVEKPNQTHESYITYDISCNEDFALHRKHHEWEKIFKFFKNHPNAMATLATKTIPWEFLEFNPEGKVRIRFSVMPFNMQPLLEPNTAPIINRLEAVDKFIEAGYDVHLNFSPVVITDGWLEDYKELFDCVDIYVKNKDKVKAEVIFLTHNETKHKNNLENKFQYEQFLWKPNIQETKTSQYGGENIRYKRDIKAKAIEDFKNLHKQVIPWNTIRYIF
jgi:spore photoproduct lyase